MSATRPRLRLTEASAARRTGNVRAGGRSARVVDTVQRTTLELLGEVGYESLRVDDVARRSGVNKTTIYRRWPTRLELVRESLVSLTEVPLPPETGDLRADLVAHVTAGVRWLMTPHGCGIATLMMRSDPNGELRKIVMDLKHKTISQRVALIGAAIARGDLPAGTDANLVAETIHAAVYSRIIRWGEAATPELIEGVIDLVLAGAKAGGAVPRARRA